MADEESDSSVEVAFRKTATDAEPENKPNQQRLSGTRKIKSAFSAFINVKKYKVAAASEIRRTDVNQRDTTACIAAGSKPHKRALAKELASESLLRYFVEVSSPSHANYSAAGVNLDYIQQLLNTGADPNWRDRLGQTVLHEIARSWSPSLMQLMLRHGAKLELVDCRGRTALHSAAGADFPLMCRAIVAAAAEAELQVNLLEMPDDKGHTPVFYAAMSDSRRALASLLQLGARFCCVKDYLGRSPIYVAAQFNRRNAAKELLEQGASAFVSDNSGQLAFVHMVEKMPKVAKLALQQLHVSKRINRLQLLHLLQLEPELPGDNGEPPFHSAMESISLSNKVELLDLPVARQFIRQQWLHFGR